MSAFASQGHVMSEHRVGNLALAWQGCTSLSVNWVHLDCMVGQGSDGTLLWIWMHLLGFQPLADCTVCLGGLGY